MAEAFECDLCGEVAKGKPYGTVNVTILAEPPKGFVDSGPAEPADFNSRLPSKQACKVCCDTILQKDGKLARVKFDSEVPRG